MSTFLYPTNEELTEIAQEKLPVLVMQDPIFTLMPMTTKDTHVLSWEQKDNYTGLQAARGLNGQPGRVKAVGGKRYNISPGVYGDFKAIDEMELTVRRQWGDQMAKPIDITDLITEGQDHLLQRRIDRIRYIGWTLLTKGVFTVLGPDGALMHSDAFPVQSYVAATPWSTNATSTPLKDYRAVKLLQRGKSTSFGKNSTSYMNQVTFNNLVANTNQNDIAGRRVTGLLSPLNQDEINKILLGEDLPQIQIWDDGYFDDNGTFHTFIPDNVAVLVGVRPGNAPVMEYVMTRNANNPGMTAGAYTKVVDKGETQVPREIVVHDGHNGGPAIYFPGSVVIMSV